MSANKKSPAKKHKSKKKTARKSPAKRTGTRETAAIAGSKAAAEHAQPATAGAGTDSDNFPIVGIGASAGGLEAMTELLRRLPKDINMSFVLIQHLAPDHESMMSELLARDSRIEVSEARDSEKLQRGHLYVIPPNTLLSIMDGVLYLTPREDGKKHFPVDHFFKSLAEDQGNNAIGIILSGSASDGTQGVKAIKAEHGLTFAQNPETASYNSMPASAIHAGLVDFILNPEEIADELFHISRRPSMLQFDIALKEEDLALSKEMKQILMLLRSRTGHDFNYYKSSTIRRRIGRRMLVHKIERLKDYVRYLDGHPSELDALFQEILINVTGFFRDPKAYEALKESVFPALMESRGADEPIRIWVIGCSSGEEVYSILIALLEHLDGNIGSIQMFATDIDQQAIEQARAGIYPESISADVNNERLTRFFTKVTHGYQISKQIRDMCVFAPQNIIKDPPFSHMDLISCRNLLIYMRNMLQRKVLQTVHYALNPDGYLLLGNSETVGASADLFGIVDKSQKIFQKKDIPSRLPHEADPRVQQPPTPRQSKPAIKIGTYGPVDIGRTAENIMLNRYGQPGALVNHNLDVLQFIGHTSPYLAPAPGSASLNLLKLAHPDLILPLRMLTEKIAQTGETVQKKDIQLRHDDRVLTINIEIVQLPERGDSGQHYLVVFQEVSHARGGQTEAAEIETAGESASEEAVQRIRELEHELEATKNYMQNIIEDHESSNEELQSANEEIQSTNEELQSTNEELETTKEELQSTNEELITVNEELENRNIELATANDDLQNLVASTDLPIVMLNEDLNIRYFSPRARTLFNLIHTDIGRHIDDMRTNLDVQNISDTACEVSESLSPIRKDVYDDSGHCYSMRVRPYRTQDNRITGVIMVFVDITEELERARRLTTVVQDSNDAIMVIEFDGRIRAWNPMAQQIYGYTEDEAVSSSINIIVPEQQHLKFMEKIDAVKNGENVLPFETQRLNKKRDKLRMLIVISALRNSEGRPTAIATTERLLGKWTDDS